MKKYLLFALMLVLLVCSSIIAFAAEDLDESLIDIKPINNVIKFNETAKFLVTITNNLSDNIQFYIDTPPVGWSVPTDNSIKVYQGKKNEFYLYLEPDGTVGPGLKKVIVNFKNINTGKIIKKYVEVEIKGNGYLFGQYSLSVIMDASVPSEPIDPREKLLIISVLENKNPLNLSGLTLRVSSDLSTLNTEQNFDLPPLTKKAVEFNYDLNPLEPPADYSVTLELLKDGKVVDKIQKAIAIKQITPPFKEELQKKYSFYKEEIAGTYTSLSNVRDRQAIKIPTTTFKSLFTKVSPAAAVVIEDNQKIYKLYFEMDPGENASIKIVTNYRILIYLLIAALLLLLVYLYYRSPVKIKKSVSDVKISDVGGISELKVMLGVSNAGKKQAKEIVVTDYVPKIAQVGKQFVEGTLKPTQILSHRTKGTIIKWEIEEILPGEERILSYSIKPTLSITGDFKLPRAKVEFKQKNRLFYSYSDGVGANSKSG